MLFDGPERILIGNAECPHDIPCIEGCDVVDLVNTMQGNILHADFLSLIYPGKALDKEIDGSQSFFGCGAHAGIHVPHVLRRDIAAYAAGLVMVFDDVGDKADIADLLLCQEDAVAIAVRRDIPVCMPARVGTSPDGFREVEHRGKIAVFSDEIGHFLGLFIEDFSDSEGTVRGKGPVAHLAEKVPDTGGILKHAVNAAEPVGAVRRVIAEGKGFFNIDNGINPEAGKAPVQPPVDHFVDLFTDRRIFPVEVGLLFVEDVEIEPVLMTGHFLPDRSSEIGPPVTGEDISVGRTGSIFVFRSGHGLIRTGSIFVFRSGHGFAEFLQIKESAVFTLRILTGPAEPLVLIRAVVDDQVHDNVQIPLCGLGQKTVHILHSAEAGIDIIIVGNVVSLICQR